MTFAEFRAEWVPKNPGQVRPQSRRFLDAETKELGLDLLIRYEHLADYWPVTCEQIGLANTLLPITNKSPSLIMRGDLTEDDMNWIKQTFSADFELLEKLPTVESKLREMAGEHN